MHTHLCICMYMCIILVKFRLWFLFVPDYGGKVVLFKTKVSGTKQLFTLYLLYFLLGLIINGISCWSLIYFKFSLSHIRYPWTF